MTEVIVFPDAVAAVCDFLRTELASRSIDATVGSRIPPLTGDVVVRVSRSGGILTAKVLDQAQLTVEVFAEHSEDAHDVIQLCRGLLHSLESQVLTTGVWVSGVNEFTGPQDFPDGVTEKPRWTMTLQMSFRGFAA